MCCHHKSVDGLEKQSGFSITQYCSVALERVKLSYLKVGNSTLISIDDFPAVGVYTVKKRVLPQHT